MTRIPFILLSTTDGTPITGAAPSVTISKDGGTFASATNIPAEIGNGYYYINLTDAETTVTYNVVIRAMATGAQPTAVVWEPEQDLSGLSTFDPSTDTVTIDSTQADTFATATALTTVGNNVSAVKAKTDNLPQSPAAVGSEMALTSAAISAVQNGLSTFNASTDTVTLNATEDGTLTAIKTKVDTLTNTDLTGIATSTDVSNAQTAIISRGNEAWITATGFTTPSDLSGLSTFNAATDTVTINSTQAAGMATATGFATPSDIPSASDNASAVWSANSRTLTESALTAADVWSYSSRTLTASALTAQQVWEYGTRTLTASPTDLTGIATSQDISNLQTHGDSNWNTATGFATPTNVSDAKTDIISAIPTDYAKPGNAMTLTSSTVASVVAGVWNYDNRELTQEIVSQVTAEDIASISIAVWSYVPRKLTSIVSDVIEPNK